MENNQGKHTLVKPSLIAPCGMNCAVCMAYLRIKNRCHGCRESYKNQPATRLYCRIKNCKKLKQSGSKYCDCEIPCKRLAHLDKRYKTKYGMSMIENLDNIRRLGIRKFVRNERLRWKCPACGGTICVHRWFCFNCGRKKRRFIYP